MGIELVGIVIGVIIILVGTFLAATLDLDKPECYFFGVTTGFIVIFVVSYFGKMV